MADDLILGLKEAFAHGDRRVRLEGFYGTQRAYVLARLLSETDAGPIVLVCPSEEDALSIVDGIRFFLGGDDSRDPGGEFAAPLGVFHYPEEESLPYEGVAYSAIASQARAGLLFRLTQPSSPVRLVVTSAAALVRQTLPRKLLLRHTELLVTGGEIDRDRLLATLVAGGYVSVPLCEDPGTYSVRGGIVDVFTPLLGHPVRIELFGDNIESLRTFDPATQRMMQNIESLSLCPVREVVLDSSTVERARDALAALAETIDFPSRKLRVIREEIENRINFFGIEAYLPALYEECETLIDYLAARDVAWLWDRPHLCRDAVEAVRERAQEEYLSTLAGHKLHFPPDRHFAPLSRADHLKAVHVEASVSADAQESLRLEAEENTELTSRLGAARAAPNAADHLRPLFEHLKRRHKERFTEIIVASSLAQAERLRELFVEARVDVRIDKQKFSLSRLSRITDSGAVAVIVIGDMGRGFFLRKEALEFVSESDIFGEQGKPRRRKHTSGGDFISDLKELKEGDALVHVDHGIGRYRGLVRLSVRGVEEDYMHLEYLGGDKLYLPVYRINLVQRYAADASSVKLDKLGGTAWETKKQRVKDAILAMAHDLLDLYAKRQLAKATKHSAPSPEFIEFEAAFPFDETPDQAKAIEAVVADMQRDQPMDRLVCGDVGYGKTEVAIRAACYAVLNKQQVAVLVPTTVLAQQHYATFSERFKSLPINVEVLSRFRDAKQLKETVQRVASGGVDVIIGTHRLLSQDVKFHNLGLVVIDEEQRFGVRHKERLRKLRTESHVLTLSATPIPRTLNMAFVGIRDLSLITTPPANRLSVRTTVTKFDEDIIREAILREITRGGQVYFVHNRVQSIHSMADYIQRIVPEAHVGIGHGQMTPDKLEEVMVNFIEKKHNVLVCTTIIESGIDIPTANTMIVNRADAFGLAQLYQLRGRIGRSNERAYAVLLVPKSERITPDAQKRLEALQRFSELGSGFKVASHDLEIRGAGNLLGPDQSGQIAAVGFELYSELVAQAVAELKGGMRQHQREPEMRLPIVALIPEKYVPDTSLRLNYYKRMAQADSDDAVHDVVEELNEFYGAAPESVEHLTQLMLIKRRLQTIGALTLDGAMVPSGGARISMSFDDRAPIDRARLVELVEARPNEARLTPDGKLVFTFSAKQVSEPVDILAGAKALLSQLVTYVKAA